MNSIGKTLVILNFIFAVTVGFLLAVDIVQRNQWKESHDSLVDKSRVTADSAKLNKTMFEKLTADLRDLQIKEEQAQARSKVLKDEYDAKTADLDVRLADAINDALKKDALVNEARAAQKRLTDENAMINKNVMEREGIIVGNEAMIAKLRTEARQFESASRTAKIQNENLLEQLQAVSKALAEKNAGVVSGEVAVIRNPNEPNPPLVQVNGKIERVDNDLVQLTVGTDHGVNKNHTLDVYRLSPESKYLGMIRIVDANHRASVGRLIPSGNAQFRTPLVAGDLVTSKLTR